MLIIMKGMLVTVELQRKLWPKTAAAWNVPQI